MAGALRFFWPLLPLLLSSPLVVVVASAAGTAGEGAGRGARWRLGKKSAESKPSRRISSTLMSMKAAWLRWLMMLWCAHGRWDGSVCGRGGRGVSGDEGRCCCLNRHS